MKKAPLDEAPLARGTLLVRHENGVDDVDDTVGLEDICYGDGGHTALGVSQHDLAAGRRCDEIFSLYGLECGLAPALHDHLLEFFCTDLAGDDMVGEDLDEGVFVFRFDEGFDGACGEFCEGVISWSEDGEGAGAVEGVDQASSLDGCDEGLVDRRVSCILDDGLVGVHGGATYVWIFLGVGVQ